MTLYDLAACPYCRMVRDRLEALGIAYDLIAVPPRHAERTEVFRVSGQTYVPVLVDEGIVLDDEDKIIQYLDTTYGRRNG